MKRLSAAIACAVVFSCAGSMSNVVSRTWFKPERARTSTVRRKT